MRKANILVGLREYEAIVRSFLDGRVSSQQFLRQYFDRFEGDPRMWGDEIHSVLEDMFFSLEYFCGDPELRDPGDLDEKDLRQAAVKAANKLGVLISGLETQPARKDSAKGEEAGPRR